MNTDKNILDVVSLAHILHVAPSTIYRWAREGKVKAHRLPGSRKLYFHRYEVEAQLNLPHLSQS